MDIINVATLALSLAAICVTFAFSLQQVRLMGYANQLPVIIELFKEWRSAEFVDREREIWAALASGEGAELGLDGIDAPLRGKAYDVCAYYQMVAYLVAFGMISEELVFLATHYRLSRTWKTVKPYVEAERERRGDPYSFLNFFEDLALMTERKSTARSYAAVRRKYFGRYRLGG